MQYALCLVTSSPLARSGGFESEDVFRSYIIQPVKDVKRVCNDDIVVTDRCVSSSWCDDDDHSKHSHLFFVSVD